MKEYKKREKIEAKTLLSWNSILYRFKKNKRMRIWKNNGIKIPVLRWQLGLWWCGRSHVSLLRLPSGLRSVRECSQDVSKFEDKKWTKKIAVPVWLPTSERARAVNSRVSATASSKSPNLMDPSVSTGEINREQNSGNVLWEKSFEHLFFKKKKDYNFHLSWKLSFFLFWNKMIIFWE